MFINVKGLTLNTEDISRIDWQHAADTAAVYLRSGTRIEIEGVHHVQHLRREMMVASNLYVTRDPKQLVRVLAWHTADEIIASALFVGVNGYLGEINIQDLTLYDPTQ